MKNTLIIFSIVMLLTSCGKKESLVEPIKNMDTQQAIVNNYSHFDYSTRNHEGLESFTLAVSHALKHEEFRQTLKTEALLQFDGDFDVLVDFRGDSKYGKIEMFILNAYIEINQINEKEAKQVLENLNMENPLLQLSVPLHCEKWNTSDYIPDVTFLPLGYDDQEDYSIKGFENNGSVIWLNRNEKPVKPVIVICENERINAENRFIEPDDGGGSGGGGSGGGSNSRVEGGREYLKNIYFSDLSAVESWLRGRPEIRLRVFSGAGGGQIYSGYLNPARSEVNESWKVYNRPMFYWNTNYYGNFIIMKWIEEDSGGTITLEEEYSYEDTTTTVTWTQKDGDDEIGGCSVGFTDPVSAVYDTGIMKWHEKI